MESRVLSINLSFGTKANTSLYLQTEGGDIEVCISYPLYYHLTQASESTSLQPNDQLVAAVGIGSEATAFSYTV